jgi:RNA polymerase sigma factor (sigma-70 family)
VHTDSDSDAMTDHAAMIAETALVIRARSGDQDAFANLWRSVERPAFGVCFHLTDNRADAMDALQDTQIAAWRGLDRFEGRSSFRSWVCVIARNAALAVLRRRAGREVSLDAVNERDAVGAPFADTVGEMLDARRALAELPAGHRHALLLWAAGLSYEEVSTALGVPVATVRVWIHRGRAKLRRLLER